MLRILVRIFAIITIFFVLALAALGTAAYYKYHQISESLPSLEAVLHYKPKLPLQVYAASGELIMEVGSERRAPISLAAIPLHVRQAFLAAEDTDFYSHMGINFKGIARASLANLMAGEVVQGASTITQQVARNFFLERDQTIERKLKEAVLSLKIEEKVSKDHIFELYLNEIYLGNGAYGVEAAALRYFGKHIREVSLAEAALLASLPKAPSAFSPLTNPQRARVRRDYILQRMADLGWTSPKDSAAAQQLPLGAGKHMRGETFAPYPAEEARRWAVESLGENAAYTNGLRIFTTIDKHLQETAQRALQKGLEAFAMRKGYRGPFGHWNEEQVKAYLEAASNSSNSLKPVIAPPTYPIPQENQPALVLEASKKEITVTMPGVEQPIKISLKGVHFSRGSHLQRGDLVLLRAKDDTFALTQPPKVEGALVALNPLNGKILAMAGGYLFEKSEFNHVTQALRQPGSSFKPILYASALDGPALASAGNSQYFTIATLVMDEPISRIDTGTGQVWEPHNYGGKYFGPISLRKALTRSLNIVSVKILETVTLPYVINYADRFGLNLHNRPYGLSLALGAAEATPLQMASAYTVFASGGLRPKPAMIEAASFADGEPLRVEGCELCVKPTPPTTVVPPGVAFLVTSMLQDVVQHGTAIRAKKLGRRDIAGKTGTTNDYVDAWFVGFSPSLVVAVWVGHDQPKSLGRRSTGSSVALPIWIDFMQEALKDIPEEEYRRPPDIVVANYNPDTGRLGGTASEYFLEGYLPLQGFAGDNGYGLAGTIAPDVQQADDETSQIFDDLF